MNPVIPLRAVFAQYPGKVPALLEAMSISTRQKFTTFDQLVKWVEKYWQKNEGIATMVRNALITVGLAEIADSMFDGATHLTAPAVSAHVRNPIGNLVNTNGGDGQPKTIWGVPEADVNSISDELLTAFKMIEEVSPYFGSVYGMAKAYNAFHSLEPQHFALYMKFKG